MSRTNSKLATVAEIAAVDFEAQDYSATPKDDRLRKIREVIDRIPSATILAVELLGLSKDELIAKVKSDCEIWGQFLMMLAESTDDLAVLQKIAAAAEARLAVALANVEGSHHDAE